jgi:hypothetical protein
MMASTDHLLVADAAFERIEAALLEGVVAGEGPQAAQGRPHRIFRQQVGLQELPFAGEQVAPLAGFEVFEQRDDPLGPVDHPVRVFHPLLPAEQRLQAQVRHEPRGGEEQDDGKVRQVEKSK